MLNQDSLGYLFHTTLYEKTRNSIQWKRLDLFSYFGKLLLLLLKKVWTFSLLFSSTHTCSSSFGFILSIVSEWINLVLVWHCQKHIFVVNGKHCSHRYRKKALYEIVSLKKGLQCFPLTSLPAALCMQTDSVPEKPWGVL